MKKKMIFCFNVPKAELENRRTLKGVIYETRKAYALDGEFLPDFVAIWVDEFSPSCKRLDNNMEEIWKEIHKKYL